MQWVSIETKISSKAEEKETTPTGPQKVHGQDSGNFNKRKDRKSESNVQTFHSCKVIHRIAFTYYFKHLFCLKHEYQSPKKEDHESESNAQTFHSCKVIHHIAFTHCIRYMFSYLKEE